MIFGVTIQPVVLLMGGLALAALFVFQILVGLRKIKFKGKLHMKVHKWTAYAMLAFVLVHGLAGLAYLNYINF